VDRQTFKGDCVHLPVVIGDQAPRALGIAAASQLLYLNMLPAKRNGRKRFFAAIIDHKNLLHVCLLSEIL
jgi:hypothetical protein